MQISKLILKLAVVVVTGVISVTAFAVVDPNNANQATCPHADNPEMGSNTAFKKDQGSTTQAPADHTNSQGKKAHK